MESFPTLRTHESVSKPRTALFPPNSEKLSCANTGNNLRTANGGISRGFSLESGPGYNTEDNALPRIPSFHRCSSLKIGAQNKSVKPPTAMSSLSEVERDSDPETECPGYDLMDKQSNFQSPSGGGGGSINLMGQPILSRPSRQNTRRRIWQSRVYNFLERPRGASAIVYHVLLFLLVFVCLVLSVISTIPAHEEETTSILFKVEVLLVLLFSVELGFRIWSAGCRSRFQNFVGRLRYLKQPFSCLDVIICTSSALILVLGSNSHLFATSALRGLRFLQILRIVRMDRRAGTWKLLGSVVYLHRQELLTTFYIGFLGLIFASFLVYQAEKGKNDKFNTYADSLWWGIVTLTTVGYGDVYPQTWIGKLTASFFAIMGISFFALPAGILGSGFALKVQQQQRQKHFARRRQPAASLIQCLWRCYAADEESLSVATWLIHVRAKPRNTTSKFKVSGSFMNRFSVRRKSNMNLDSNAPLNNVVVDKECSDRRRNESPQSSLRVKRKSETGSVFSLNFGEGMTSRKNSCDTEDETEITMLTKLRRKHKTAIRFIRKMKFFVSRRKFKEALKPYDVKDVIEQYSAGHVDLLSRVKDLQTRIDVVIGSKDKKKHEKSKITMSSRIIRVESQMTHLERKLDYLINMYRKDQLRQKTDADEGDPQQSSQPNSASIQGNNPIEELRNNLQPLARSRSHSQPSDLDHGQMLGVPQDKSNQNLTVNKVYQSSPSVSRSTSIRVRRK